MTDWILPNINLMKAIEIIEKCDSKTKRAKDLIICNNNVTCSRCTLACDIATMTSSEVSTELFLPY